MSLRYQIAVLILSISAVLVTASYVLQQRVILPAFAELESQAALRNVARAVEALQRDIEAIGTTASDWAAWDDSYQFLVDGNDGFREANLMPQTFENTRLSLVCFIDTQHRIVWGETCDAATLQPIDAPDLFQYLVSPDCILTTFDDVDDHCGGILLTDRGPILIASRPSTTTNVEGPIHGAVIMGRFLTADEIAGLANRTRMQLELCPIVGSAMPPDVRRQVEAAGQSEQAQVEAIDGNTLWAYTLLRDIQGQPALLLRLRIPRDVMAQGRASARAATQFSVAGGLLTMLVLWFGLQWRILNPLQMMVAHAVRVGRNDDLKARLNFKRRDEIGALAAEFDAMVASLGEWRKKVLDSAHRAGMAEIASEVLHNVGNAVNSANCSLQILDERLDQSKLDGLERAAALLREQAPQAGEFFARDPRGPKLIDYLVGVNQALHAERDENLAEVERLREVVGHIRDVIAAQQAIARRSDFRQDVSLADLVDEALRLNEDLIRSARVQVHVDLPQLPELQLNKNRLAQVLVNLIRNAVQAMQDQPAEGRRLTITAQPAEDGGIEIEVRDTGAGFDEETRQRLFTHGFTTKPEGNGYGLHYCANAIRETGGQVSAYSDGPGRGSMFQIQLPNVLPAEVAAS